MPGAAEPRARLRRRRRPTPPNGPPSCRPNSAAQQQAAADRAEADGIAAADASRTATVTIIGLVAVAAMVFAWFVAVGIGRRLPETAVSLDGQASGLGRVSGDLAGSVNAVADAGERRGGGR